MKLLTLNTHSLMGEDFERRAERFVAALLREAPDVIALQEVNQRQNAPLLRETPSGFVEAWEGIPLREDLYALWLVRRLAEGGLFYHWSWIPVKLGYGQYEEGLALLCRRPIGEARSFLLSRDRAFEDWKRREALMVRPRETSVWFCNLHTGWWDDGEEPFAEQWERLLPHLRRGGTVFLMGDLNNPAEVRGEGYDRVRADGFYDTYLLAESRRGGGTAGSGIDGWRGRFPLGMTVRIDQIWCDRPCPVITYRTVFDGVEYERVSDHFGVMVTLKEGER